MFKSDFNLKRKMSVDLEKVESKFIHNQVKQIYSPMFPH